MTQAPENPVLVLMARAILARSYGPGRVPDLESRGTRAWREALADAQAAFSVLPVEKGSDSAGRSERPQEASPERLTIHQRLRLEALADAYEPGNYALCDGVYHVYAGVPECCQALRDDLRAALSYSGFERRVCDYLQEIMPDIGCGEDPVGFLIASHNWLRGRQVAPLSEPIDFPSNNTEGERL